MQPTGSDFPKAKVSYIGHATALIEMDGVRIVTDPLFRDRLWFLKRRSGVAHALAGVDPRSIDVVALSHMHFDHMDYPSLRMIPKDVPIIAPEGAARYLEKKVGHDIAEMSVGESIRVGGIDIHATPSLHESGAYWPMWYPKTVLSYVFEGPQTVYFVGDTALFEGMEDVGRQFDIDAALLPVWGYGPYVRGDHLTPSDAAWATAKLNPRVAVPIHWGTYHPVGPFFGGMSFLDEPPRAFALEATKLAPGTDVRVLYPGESTLVGGEIRVDEVVESFEPAGAPVLEPALAWSP